MIRHNIFATPLWLIGLVASVELGCSGSLPPGTCNGNGVGGAGGTDPCSTGGALGTSGTVTAGGAVTGGESGIGGALAGGSSSVVGDTGGAISTGGVGDTGGAISTGGVGDTGGAISTGGVGDTGGAISTGGVGDTGGAISAGGGDTGGATSTGGSDTGGSGIGGAGGGGAGGTTGNGGTSDFGGTSGMDTGGTSSVGGSATGGTSNSTSLRDGCVLLLHMDESAWSGAASVLDSSGQANNGSPTGNASITADGKFSHGGLFDGVSSVLVNDSPTLRPTTALSVAAWIYPTAIDGQQAYGVIAKRIAYGDNSTFTLFLFTDKKLFVDIDGENDRFSSNTVFAANTWYHVAVIFDGTLPQAQRVRIYVNGTLDITASETSSSIGQYTAPLQVGTLPGSTGYYGTIDEVGVWNRALSDGEIAQLQIGPVP